MKQVKTIARLQKLAEAKRAVKYRNWDRPIPAVVVLNMTCSVVLNMLRGGVYEYRKGGK